jgi:hypothetical protein
MEETGVDGEQGSLEGAFTASDTFRWLRRWAVIAVVAIVRPYLWRVPPHKTGTVCSGDVQVMRTASREDFAWVGKPVRGVAQPYLGARAAGSPAT